MIIIKVLVLIRSSAGAAEGRAERESFSFFASTRRTRGSSFSPEFHVALELNFIAPFSKFPNSLDDKRIKYTEENSVCVHLVGIYEVG